MKFIEIDTLPKEIEAAILTDHYHIPGEKPSDYSTTEIIAPIQKTELHRRYKDTDKLVKEEVLDKFNAWVGSIIHNAIEDAWKKGMGSIVEERFYMEFGDKTLSGKVDCLDGTRIIDWKTCRVYKVVKGDVAEWEKQANIYALLAEHNGYKIDELNVFAIVLDLTKAESKWNDKLPNKPIVKFVLNRWPNLNIINYIEERLRLLALAKTLTDKELFEQMPCTRTEQWSTLKDISVFKKGEERATKVCATEEEANSWLADHKKFTTETHEVRYRYKKRTRCLDYCDAKNVCLQFKQEQGNA